MASSSSPAQLVRNGSLSPAPPPPAVTLASTPAVRRPHLRIQTFSVFVSDVERSLSFYRDQLGFTIAFDVSIEPGHRWVAVAPPNGDTILSINRPRGDQDAQPGDVIGQHTNLTFLTEDFEVTYAEWLSHGVQFVGEPVTPDWGGRYVAFQDPDGNSFVLIGVDALTRQIEERRRETESRFEAERRAAQELEIARQVQARLFPQALPALATLDFAGLCVQANAVGGDYYDFIELGPERIAFILGDIAGKGMAGALLMANLQANLRSQPNEAFDDPAQMLRCVNRLFYRNTCLNAYATLFFAEYDGIARRLRFANCGHLCALLVRPDEVVRLEATGTVLGLFADWECTVSEVPVRPGDLFVLYTDGVTEAYDSDEVEFGEDRLLAAIARHRQLPAAEIAAAIAEEVRAFSAGQAPHDDITLIVAKVRG
jgi:serine phosphatase RsbU (regulator of sigma subunit)/catechol 2,3-dioxygenase-like lactoylglutathione lyase family enzyme